MSQPYFCAVIGKGFGDEGKGMAVDFLSSGCKEVLVIRHNGGAQSGHTVELPGKRFVFRELSSGSFRRADTFWADTFFPDMYKLGEELVDFRAIHGTVPTIYADPGTPVTIIDDVFLNMAVEEARGAHRHGSCGMGIYEAQCRSNAGFAITMGELFGWEERRLITRLQEIRREYLPGRLKQLGLRDSDLGEYGGMLKSNDILENVVKEMLQNIRSVKLVEDLVPFLNRYEKVIFENGQGLLLDSENDRYAPHVTASRTGLTNPCRFLQRFGFSLQEVIYVTRSYVTRHGAGDLPNECSCAELGIREPDQTNRNNIWQGKLRYAKHEEMKDFIHPIKEDMQILQQYQVHKPLRSLMITHLNETYDCMVGRDGIVPVADFCRLPVMEELFDRYYLSASRYAADIKVQASRCAADIEVQASCCAADIKVQNNR